MKTTKMNIHQNLIRTTSALRTLASVLAIGATLSTPLCAATIISDNFSYGYGKTTSSVAGAEPAWAPQGTVTTPGSLFSLTPVVTSTMYSAGGPLFTNRVIQNTGGPSGYSGNSANLKVNLGFAYTGPAPVDAAPIPNYQISLIITSISIYGVQLNQPAAGTLAFSETTVGHTSTSSAISLNNLTGATSLLDSSAAQYKQLVWNPDDFFSVGENGTRSFQLLTETNPVGGLPFARVVDGFEVFGRLELTYDAIPEPSTIALGIVGLAGVLFFRKRKQLA